MTSVFQINEHAMLHDSSLWAPLIYMIMFS